LIYNTGGIMKVIRRLLVIAVLGLAFMSCAMPSRRPLVDPFPLSFPLVEAGTLEIEGRVVGQPWARDGVVYFATSDGFLTAVVIPSRSVLWRRPGAGGPGEASDKNMSAEPERRVLRVEEERLLAFDGADNLLWEFAADGTITADPAISSGRVYFGTENRRFYCLKAATGKVKWRRRLQGAPLHPAVVSEGVIAVPASNSVVYFLSARGGSILSWETVPSRIVYRLAPAGRLVLVSSAAPEVAALKIKTGMRVGQYLASGPLAAGAVWSPPYVVLFVEDAASGRQRIVFLRSR
jgi:outer membrane protein assembly factor BamB